MDKEYLISHLRTIPDFPRPGILFFDITTWLKDPRCVRELADEICRIYRDKGITKVVGLESRGFMLGGLIAYKLGAGFVPERKPGKLPYKTVRGTYQKEYGEDILEIHSDAINEDDVVLVHDDLLATGGTAGAAIDLIKSFKPRKIYANFMIEITDIPGRDALPSDVEVTSLLKLSEK